MGIFSIVKNMRLIVKKMGIKDEQDICIWMTGPGWLSFDPDEVL